VWQTSVAVISGLAFAYLVPEDSGHTLRALYIPFVKDAVISDMGIFAVAMFSLIIVGASNAVNLTDGLDGLATGCSLTTALAYAPASATSAAMRNTPTTSASRITALANELPIIAMALAGACLGFLWFNAHPAKMFMGDTGSLALGGCIAALAIGCKQEIVLALVGGVFVMEAMSVILQVWSFKSRGKRIFRMAPIHHHFELAGWHENQVIVRFWIMSLAFAMLGLATLKLRY
jgi:phospho-N-acetylmuramoyl-pentapeptide-transferase